MPKIRLIAKICLCLRTCSRYAPKKQKVPKSRHLLACLFLWELRDSNPRPSACKADALNQLS